jgi:ABC-2 type transport system permease protein
VGTIARRELASLFVSPVAYVVLTLFSVLAGFFFLSSVLSFSEAVSRLQQMIGFDPRFAEQLARANLNDDVIFPFLGAMSIVLLFLVPGITMGLFASETANGTDELLLTSPLTIWEIVLGKFLAAAGFLLLLVGLVALFPGILFVYGDPEVQKTLAGLLGLLLVGLTYVAIGCFASSVTSSQVIAFVLSFVMLLLLWMLSFLADLGAAGGPVGQSGLSSFLRWLSSSEHFEQLVKGLVDTSDLAYFGALIGTFLLLTKAAVESVRWR